MSSYLISFRQCSILGDAAAARIPGYRGKAAEIAAQFHRENLAGVHARYPDTVFSPSDLPGPVNEIGKPFTFQHTDEAPPAVELFDLVVTWQYQTMFAVDHRDGEAWRVSVALRTALASER